MANVETDQADVIPPNNPRGDPPDPLSVFPEVFGPLTWSSCDFAHSADYILQLQRHAVDEVLLALKNFKSLGLHGDEASIDNFVLPSLRTNLRTIADDLHNGRGFCVLRGLPSVPDISVEDSVVLFLGLGDYIGGKRGIQNRKGDMLTHVTESRHWVDKVSPNLRHGIHTTGSLPFHTDMGASILALQVRSCAQVGGNTYVASSWTIYNDLAANHPETLQVLSESTWPIQVSGRQARYILAPLIAYHDGNIIISLDPGRLGLHPSTALGRRTENCSVPPLTDKQQGALGVLAAIATKHRVQLDIQTGDFIFINNWALLHARDAYQDCAGSDINRRHLVRLWLHNPEFAWDIPTGMLEPWQAAFGYEDSGDKSQMSVWWDGRPLSKQYALVPGPEYKAPKYTAGSAAFVIEDSESESDGLEP